MTNNLIFELRSRPLEAVDLIVSGHLLRSENCKIRPPVGGLKDKKTGIKSPEQFFVPTPSVAKDLMPREIMSSEPRPWMLFGRLVLPVQCCAEPEAPAAAVPQHSTAQA